MTHNINQDIEGEINKLIDKNIAKTKSILVFSGGGVKGISYFGVFKALEKLKLLQNINTFAATSVGTMVMSLYLMGYNIEELDAFYQYFEFKNLTTVSDFQIDNITNLFENLGLDSGKNIIKVLGTMLENKKINKDITLLDFYKLNKKKFILTTCCLDTNTVEYLSYETHPTLKLSEAVRMSTAVPLYFCPYKYNNKFYIDGGCLDNYPISLFTDKLDEVIGVYVDVNIEDNKISNLKDYIYSILKIMSKGMTKNIIRGWDKVTIFIKTKQSNLLNFNITLEEKKELVNEGYKQTINFFTS